MKKIFMMLGIASMITLISSCTSDPCEGKTATELCSGKGTLADQNGTCGCNCDAGYEGTKCETLTITSLIGDWNQTSSALLNGQANARSGKTKITQEGSAVNRIKITNLNQFFSCTNGGVASDVICYANINGEVILDEAMQCGHIFKGKGVRQTDGSWKFTYTTTVGSNVYNCETTLKK
jgi:hypothetical protein